MPRPPRKPRAKTAPKKHGGVRPGSGRKPKRWIADYEALGPLPSDPLEQLEWGCKALMVSLQKTTLDPALNERDRSASIRAHLKTIKDLVPKARILEAERRILAFEKRMQEPAKPADGEAVVTAVEAPAEPQEPQEPPDANPDAGEPLSASYRDLRTRRAR